MHTGYFGGGDYCDCRRCPCCGKLVAAPYSPWYPYPYTYTIPYTVPYVVSGTIPGTIDWGASTITITVADEKK